ncbi:MAG: hypothetical protein Hens2KO_27810 [Henriciella sp.]
MAKLFISYKSEQRAKASLVVDVLSSDYDVWWDQRIPFGERWRDEILREMFDSDCMLALLCRRSLESVECFAEVQHAAENQKCVGLVLEPLSNLSPTISKLPKVSFEENDWRFGAGSSIDDVRTLLKQVTTGSVQ